MGFLGPEFFTNPDYRFRMTSEVLTAWVVISFVVGLFTGLLAGRVRPWRRPRPK